jgi:putative Mn2+ efflux pump MntP
MGIFKRGERVKKLLFLLLSFSTMIFANLDINTSTMQAVKESHFEKHIEFWTIFITLCVVGVYYIYKKKFK